MLVIPYTLLIIKFKAQCSKIKVLNQSVELFLEFLELISYRNEGVENVRRFLGTRSVLTQILTCRSNLESLHLDQVIDEFHLLNILVRILTHLVHTRLRSEERKLLFPLTES